MHFVEIIIEYLPIFMFVTMGVLLFIGYPVGFILGGVAITYGFIGYMFGVFRFAEFFNFVPRIWWFSAENLILVAIPLLSIMVPINTKLGMATKIKFSAENPQIRGTKLKNSANLKTPNK